MAPRGRRRTGEGFSLVDLQPTLTSAVSSITDELSSQGVDIDTNSLLMGVQNLVNSLVMNNPGSLMASDTDSKPPYNVAADLLAMAYQDYQVGEKREAIKKFLAACDFEDAETLNEALLLMNSKADINKQLSAAEDDEDNEDTEDQEPDSDEDDSDELSDEEIDDLISEGDKDDTDSDDEDDTIDDSAPMGGTSSSKPVTASTPQERASRILAIKMSSDGTDAARQRAQRLITK